MSDARPVVVAGATGFVGTHLVDRLERAGVPVRCGSRSPERASRRWPDRTWVELDVDDPSTLGPALEGARALVYLVHHMASHDDGDLLAAEERAAHRVVEACGAAGVERIVYLGGPEPEGEPSKHLASRLTTGRVLRGGGVSTIELRAGMIIGVGSESWLIVRDLAMRLPAMILPSWLKTRSQPIHIDDVVAALALAVDHEQQGSAWYDLPGPEVLSARQIMERVAAQAGMKPVMIEVPILSPALSSHWIRWVTRADYEVARQLVAGLTSDLVSPDEGFWDLYPDYRRVPFDEAVRRALAAEEAPGAAGRWEKVARRLAARA